MYFRCRFWETQPLVSVGKPPPDWQKVQICVLVSLIKAPGSAGIIFKVLFFFSWLKSKLSSRWVTLFVFWLSKEKGYGEKLGSVVLLYCICVEDTLNQNLKSLCAHSLAASMKSFNWEYSELTLWRQVISKYAEITCFSQCYAACSALTLYFITENISGVSLRHGRMQRVISIQPPKVGLFDKQNG